MTRRQILAFLVVLISLASGQSARTQAPTPSPNANRGLATSALVGTWQGTITVAGNTLRIGLLVTQSDAAALDRKSVV